MCNHHLLEKKIQSTKSNGFSEISYEQNERYEVKNQKIN